MPDSWYLFLNEERLAWEYQETAEEMFSSGGFRGGAPPYFWTKCKLRPEGPKIFGGETTPFPPPPPALTHFIRVNRAAVMHGNSSQTPVIAVNQPLFTLAKEIQCRRSGAYEEDSFLCLAVFTWRWRPGICSASVSLALDDWKKLAVLEWWHKVWLNQCLLQAI